MKRKPTKLINVLVALSLLLGFVQTIPVMAKNVIQGTETTIGFDQTTADATTCGTIEVNVVVADVVALTGYHLEMTFEHDKLEVLEVVNGGLLYDEEDRAGLYEPESVLNMGNDTGRLTWGMAQRGVNGDPTPVTGSGNLVTIKLKALATSGTTDLEIDAGKTMLVDWPDAFEIDYTVSGKATISLASCAPTSILLDNNSVNENEPVGTTVGNLTATDPDTGDTITFTLGTGGDNDSFKIVGNVLQTNAVFDFETKASYTITVRATDAGGAYLDKVFTITVIDVNDAPVLAPIGAKSVVNTETLSFTPTATDEDLPAATLSWSLGTGAPEWVSIDAGNGKVTLTPTVGTAPGTYEATICVSDSELEDCETISITVTDGVSPIMENVSPARGIVYLADGENFVLVIDAKDDNLYSLEVDHSFGPPEYEVGDALYLPEFTVYADKDNPWGSDEAKQLAEDTYGIDLNYDAVNQIWTIDFGAAITNTYFIPNGVTFHLVLHDKAGNTWGSMFGTTPDNTYAYTFVRDDVPPVMDLVTPERGVVYLADGENFVLTVDAFDLNLHSLEVDHSFEGTLPEFTVYADKDNPWGSDEAKQLAEDTYGIDLQYDEAAHKWTIDFGKDITDDYFIPHGVTFYLVLHDKAGNTWGSMSPTTPDNTYAYTFVRDDVPPVMDEVTPERGVVYLAAGENFVLTVDAFDLNLHSLEVDHSFEGTLPEFTVYADKDNPWGSDEAKELAEDTYGIDLKYDEVNQIWTIDFGAAITNTYFIPNGVTFYLVLHDKAGNTWGSMFGTTPDNTYAYTFVRDNVDPKLISVTPPHDSTVLLGIGDTFKLTIEAEDDNLYELEVDHSMETTQPEFSVYASEGDPYGGDEALFAAAGVTVTYDAGTQTWEIDFGADISKAIADNGGITFYLVLKDMAGNTWGSMNQVEEYNTFKYIVSQDLVAPTIVSGEAIGATGFGDVTAGANLAFVVNQGYTVDHIEFEMSEAVTVVPGTMVTLGGKNYGAVTVSGTTLIVTPTATSKVASVIGGPFTFSIPADSIKDLAGNPLTTLSATLTVLNVAPVAVDDTYTTDEDVVLNVPDRGVLSNDTDYDVSILTAVLVDGPTNGTLTLNVDGGFAYTPAANFNGIDSFTYIANDGLADSNVATVTITVTAVNDAPVAVNDTYATSFEKQLTVDATDGVLKNDSDIDGDDLTAVLVANVSNGTLALEADGSFTYTPNTGFSGVDTFTYKAFDGTLYSDIATVSITVSAFANTPPVAVADTYETDENVELVVAAPGVLWNDYDIDGDNLTATLKTNVTNGTLVLLEDGSFTYKPDTDFCGTDSFDYTLVSYPRITADDGWTADATATITVYCDAIISSDDLGGPFYVGNLQEFQVRLQNPAPGHEYGSLAASIFVDGITLADFSKVEVMHPLSGTWVPLTPVVDGTGLRIDLGPISSIPVISGFDQTLSFRVNFNTAGSYPVTGTLYDGAIDPTKAIATYSDTMIVAGLLAQDFGYMYQSGVLGVTAGFKPVNFTLDKAVEIKVELFTGPDTGYVLLQTNTAISPAAMATWTQFSGPFDIFGTFDYVADNVWSNDRETEYGQTAIPTRVLATITFPGGITLTAENTNLTGDRGYILNTLDEELASAPGYVYDPVYTPVGDIEFDINNNTYTGTYTAPQVLAGGPMNDMARYLGALYRQAGSTITSIVFDGKTYSWNPAEPNTGSNWIDGDGRTLVSVVTAKFQAAILDGTWTTEPGYTMTVHDDYDHSATVTFKMIILNTLDDELESAPGYVYTPGYTYVGSWVFDDPTNIYTLTYNDTNFAPGAMNDLARYLGALHRQAGATVFTIEYKGTSYSWDPVEPNVGSNWYAGSTSLVSEITADVLGGLIDPAVGFTLKLSDAFHTENVTFRFIINDTTAPTVVSGEAIGAAGFDDVAADASLTFVVNQGYTVDHIEFVMSEAVTVVDGTEVMLGGVPYGTITANGALLTVTPYPGNTVASLIGSFVFNVPEGKIFDLSGNPLGTLSATLIVVTVNNAPEADDQAVTTSENTPVAITLVATDVDGDTLTYAIVTQPAHGTVSLVGNVATYTPSLNYNGSDSFTFKSYDGLAYSNVATVTILVKPSQMIYLPLIFK